MKELLALLLSLGAYVVLFKMGKKKINFGLQTLFGFAVGILIGLIFKGHTLYGVLRPLDLLQAYRLEMGTKLANARGSDLYQFWGEKIAQYLNTRLQAQGGEPVLVNLASQEYFKSIDRRVLKARVVECVFEDYKDGKYKIIAFFAKRARGLMMRYVIEHQVNTVEGLTGFDSAGYAWAPDASGPDRLVFRRRQVGV